MKRGGPSEQTQKFQSHDTVLDDNAKSLSEQLNKCETMEDTLKILAGPIKNYREVTVDDPRYIPLYRAIVEKDWKGVKDFIAKYPEALDARFTEIAYTCLHLILLLTDHDEACSIIKEIFLVAPPGLLLSKTDETGSTVLDIAAAVGNTKAVKLFALHEPRLPNIKNDISSRFPIHSAAFYGHKETVLYLLSVTSDRDNNPSPFADESGVFLLLLLIKSNLYGIALGLLKRYTNLRERPDCRKSVLDILSRKPQGFASGNRMGYWQRLIYHCIPVKEECIPSFQTSGNENVDMHMQGDMEMHTTCGCCRQIATTCDLENRIAEIHTSCGCCRCIRQIATTCGALRNQELHTMLWNALMCLAPCIKSIHDTKLSNMQTVEIVRMMCANNDIWSYKEASEILKDPVLRAARLGIFEFVVEIIEAYRNSIFLVNREGNNIFQLAVLHRQEKVFNLIHKTGQMKAWVGFTDNSQNNILHLAGQSVPSSQLAGAALQMQRELQWFQAVENLVHPSLREVENSSKETPREVFTKQHEKLVEKGEKWMKDAAQSFSVVAALIITVVFAAAFTLPGGSDTRGVPHILHDPTFLTFIISDALALFTSSISVLMFLAILTSRYSQEDFLESSPKKLIIGLIALFLSIASMMIAFGVVIHMTISGLWSLVFIPIFILACVTVTIFVRLQFPLLLDMILSTYGPSIFQPKQ